MNITNERLNELIEFLEETKEKMPYEHIEDELACLKELSALRVNLREAYDLLEEAEKAILFYSPGTRHPLADKIRELIGEQNG